MFGRRGGFQTRRYRRGGFQTRPYNDDNSVNMIWHNNKCIQFHIRVMIWQIIPNAVHDSPCIVQSHFPSHHLAEQARTVMRANGDKIRPDLRIIVSLDADAAAVVAGLKPVRTILINHNPRSFKNRSASLTRNSLEMSLGKSVSRRVASRVFADTLIIIRSIKGHIYR